MWHPNPKSILTSRTAWSALIAIIGGVATIYTGREIKLDDVGGVPADQLAGALADAANTFYVSGGAAAIGGVFAIVFRMMAKRPATVTGNADVPPTSPGNQSMNVGGKGFKSSDRYPFVQLPAGIVLALLLCSCGPNWTPFGSAAPPYGVLSYKHAHKESFGQDGKPLTRECNTEVSGGVETAGATLNGTSCGDTVGGTTAGITAFEGQGNGAAIYAAKVQADLQRDLALINAGQTLGATGICGVLLGTGAGAAVPAAAAAACGKALGAALPNAPTIIPQKQGWVRGKTGTLRRLAGQTANGKVVYSTPGGHVYTVSDRAWQEWINAEL